MKKSKLLPDTYHDKKQMAHTIHKMWSALQCLGQKRKVPEHNREVSSIGAEGANLLPPEVKAILSHKKAKN